MDCYIVSLASKNYLFPFEIAKYDWFLFIFLQFTYIYIFLIWLFFTVIISQFWSTRVCYHYFLNLTLATDVIYIKKKKITWERKQKREREKKVKKKSACQLETIHSRYSFAWWLARTSITEFRAEKTPWNSSLSFLYGSYNQKRLKKDNDRNHLDRKKKSFIFLRLSISN